MQREGGIHLICINEWKICLWSLTQNQHTPSSESVLPLSPLGSRQIGVSDNGSVEGGGGGNFSRYFTTTTTATLWKNKNKKTRDLCNPSWPWTYNVATVDPELLVLLSLPPTYWDYRYMPPYPVNLALELPASTLPAGLYPQPQVPAWPPLFFISSCISCFFPTHLDHALDGHLNPVMKVLWNQWASRYLNTPWWNKAGSLGVNTVEF